MPNTDDFDVDEIDTPAWTDDEVEAARRLLAQVDGPPDVVDHLHDVAESRQPNRAERRKKGRKRAPVPEGAPEPQDHLSKADARQAEATGNTFVLTLWDETIEIEQSTLFDSWDFQLGTVQNNPLMMVKGLLGDKRFAWFAARARADGKTPVQAASEVMQMFARATGFESSGK